MQCLQDFYVLSGLKPNINKSSVFFCNCDNDLISWFDSRFCIPHGTLPVRFLGVPLISSRLGVNDCTPLIDKITTRIYSWTNMFLSLAGRAQLIKSVLFAMQAYWCSHFLLPGVVHKHLQKLFSRFLWKGDISKKGGAKVSWKSLCLPRTEGGLGFKNALEWNKSQLILLLCKIVSNYKSLWPSWVNKTALKRHHFWAMPIPTDFSWIFLPCDFFTTN